MNVDQALAVVTPVADYLNANPPVVLAVAGVLAVLLQSLVNKYADFGKYTNRILGLTAYPGVVGAFAALSTGLPAKYVPLVGVLSQVFYATHQAYKNRLVESAQAPVGQF